MPHKDYSLLTGDKTKDAKIIFEHGEEFFRALLMLHNKNTLPELMTFMRAVNVIQAFAAEIYLKSLICLQAGKVPPIHYVYNLFRFLKPGVALLLQIKWDEIVTSASRKRYLAEVEAHSGLKIARDLEGALKQGNRGFERLRYAYEPGKGGGGSELWFLGDLPVALRRTILDMQPTWGAQDTLKF